MTFYWTDPWLGLGTGLVDEVAVGALQGQGFGVDRISRGKCSEAGNGQALHDLSVSDDRAGPDFPGLHWASFGWAAMNPRIESISSSRSA